MGVHNAAGTQVYRVRQISTSPFDTNGALGGSATAGGTGGSLTTGIYYVSRTGPTSLSYYRDGTTLGTNATSVTPADPLFPFYVFGANENGSALRLCAVPMGAYWTDTGLDATEQETMHDILVAYGTTRGWTL
jgi:hypothetical protein